MKQILIWDFDGVIVNSWELDLELTRKYYPELSEEDHRNLFNGNIHTTAAALTKTGVTEEEYRNYVINDYRPRKLKLEPVPGIFEVIEQLAQKYTMVINSSSGSETIGMYLTQHNMRQHFQKIYGKDISKSKEEKFRMIMNEYGVEPKHCVMITDTVGDVLEARACDIPSIISLWGFQLRDHFVDHPNLELVQLPTELTAAVENHFKKLQ